MSRRVVEWAMRQRCPRPDDKLVLLIMADALNEKSGLCCPSVAAVSASTGLERKRVMASLTRLQAVGQIIDTGERIGRTKQVRVWAFPDTDKESGFGTVRPIIPDL